MTEIKKVTGTARAFSDKNGWWKICLSTPEGDVWVSPGIKASTPCPASKGQIVECSIQGIYNQVVAGTLSVRSPVTGDERPTNKPQVQTGFKPRNNVGQQVGHAINSAFDLIGYGASQDEIIKTAKFMASLTEEIRTEYGAANPEMSDYELGASVGQAVRTAASIVNARGLDHSKVKGIAMSMLERVQREVAAYLEAGSHRVETPAPVQEQAQKPVESPVVTEVPEVVPEPAPVQEAPVTKPEPVVETVVAPAQELPSTAAIVEDLDDDLPW